MAIGGGTAASGAEAGTVLSGSVKLIGGVGGRFAGAPNAAVVTRLALTDAETSATLDIEVSLIMRDFAGLQDRLSHGEKIPRAEMAEKYLPLQSDSARIAQWLAAQGLTVTHQDDTHLAVFARGSVAQLASAFRITFARVMADGAEFTSAITAPTVPSTMAAVVVGVNGLQPHLRVHRAQRSRVVADAVSAAASPYSPSQLKSAYNVPALTGIGQTIAVIEDTFPTIPDLTLFWQTYGVPETSSNITMIPIGGGPLGATADSEAALDVEWGSAIAPAAKFRVYGVANFTLSNTNLVCQQIYTDLPSFPGMHQLSLSYGSLENDLTRAIVQSEAQEFALLAGAGVTIFAASGDGGSNPNYSSADGWTNTYPNGAQQCDYPASDLNVTAVGGTSLNLAPDGSVGSELAWTESGGGPSIFIFRPAWQTGPGVPTGTMRLTPDVAAVGDPNTGVNVVFAGKYTISGGTSLGTPVWAGIAALINQARATAGAAPLGALNQQIYPLIGTPAFWDITTGNTGGFVASAGYDLCTGVGVPNVANLVSYLGGGSLPTPGSPAFGSRPATVSVGAGTAATIPVVATGSGSLVYRWQRQPLGANTWTNLTDGGNYSGTASAALQIHAVPAAMTGDQFRCVVSNGAGTATGPVTTLVTAFPLNVTTLAGFVGRAGSTDGTGNGAQFNQPFGLAVDVLGNLYVSDFVNETIRKVTAAGVVSTFAGLAHTTGNADGTGAAARFNGPAGLALDGLGNLYVGDSANNTIREITPGGVVTTIAGSPGKTGSTDGRGTAARFNDPEGVAVDTSGNIYVTDSANDTVRKITAAGDVTTLAGLAGVPDSADGQGSSARFDYPWGIAVDQASNVWVTDYVNDTIREISPSGQVTTVAGLGGATGDADGTGSVARFVGPVGLTIDASGNLYITDGLDQTVRMVTPGGTVSTLAGFWGNVGSSDGPTEYARFNSPGFPAIDPSNNLYLADTGNNTIRKGALTSTPQILLAPRSETVGPGGYSILSVTGGGGGLSYQWFLNGAPIAGATAPTLSFSSVQASNAGAYTVTVTNSVGSVTTSPAVLTVPVPGTVLSRLSNLSTRALVASGGTNIICGFYIGGTGTKQMLLRGVGPTLSQFGLVAPLSNPQLQLFDSNQTLFATDAAWGGSAALSSAFARVYAFPLPPTSADSALLETLPAGGVSAHISALSAAGGIALAEIYDIDGPTAPARLVNLSSSAFAGTGNNALVAGFVIAGSTSETVLVRGIGPGLTQFNVSGALTIPSLSLFDSNSNVIATNTGWGGTAALQNAFNLVYAFALPMNSADCALLITLPPGAYSAQVSGVNGATGQALIEVYEVP